MAREPRLFFMGTAKCLAGLGDVLLLGGGKILFLRSQPVGSIHPVPQVDLLATLAAKRKVGQILDTLRRHLSVTSSRRLTASVRDHVSELRDGVLTEQKSSGGVEGPGGGRMAGSPSEGGKAVVVPGVLYAVAGASGEPHRLGGFEKPPASA